MAKTEKTTATVDVEVRIGSLLPNVTSTSEERLQALRDAKAILAGTEGITKAFFGDAQKGGSQYPDPYPLFRVAEYITTGHDYNDTHPKIEDGEVSGDRYEEEGQNDD
jgi:hypothetical protein